MPNLYVEQFCFVFLNLVVMYCSVMYYFSVFTDYVNKKHVDFSC